MHHSNANGEWTKPQTMNLLPQKSSNTNSFLECNLSGGDLWISLFIFNLKNSNRKNYCRIICWFPFLFLHFLVFAVSFHSLVFAVSFHFIEFKYLKRFFFLQMKSFPASKWWKYVKHCNFYNFNLHSFATVPNAIVSKAFCATIDTIGA